MKINELFGLITREGQPIPLNEVDVRGTLVGRGARVKVTQVFENRESKPIEAVYKFPLPENSTVCRFKIVVGDKITEGTVEERDKAFQLYDEALTRGDGGYLLDEERPNIFTLSVGNLNPGASASVEIEYVALLDAKGTEVRFFLPTTISPRYVPERTPDKGGIPVDHQVNPPISMKVPYHLSILLEIQGKETISSVDSPSHPVSIKFDDEVIKAEFTSGAVAMDRDFVLNIHYKDLFQNRGYIFDNEKGNFIQLDLCPTVPDGEEASAAGKEVIFILDCSGSMGGDFIHQAKTALEIFLKALREGTRFNLYRFGSTYEKLFPESLPYNADNLRDMLSRLKRIDADLGGTEVLAPLKEIYQSKIPAGYSREVILITDGEIGNESEVLDLIKEGDQGSRLFTVGIGYGPNEYFIRQLTRVAGATSELIAPGERIESKILRLFKQVMSEKIGDFRIDWGSGNLQTEQAPFNPVLFVRESMSIFARVKGSPNILKEVTVSFRAGKNRGRWSVPVQEIRGDEVPVHLLWAKERIRDLEEGTAEGFKKGSRQAERREKQTRNEVIQLSREFGILSRETSFVAIEKRTGDEKTKGEVVLRKVPVMLTKGWGEMEFDIAPSATMLSAKAAVREKRVRVKPGPPTRQDALMKILSLQRAQGGFEIDEEISRRIGVTIDDLEKLSRKIKVIEKADLLALLSTAIRSLDRAQGGFEIDEELSRRMEAVIAELERLCNKIDAIEKPDMLALLSTAIILELLKKYYSDREDEWKDLAGKTVRWFKDEVSRTHARIDGIRLEDWAAQFINTLNSKIFIKSD